MFLDYNYKNADTNLVVKLTLYYRLQMCNRKPAQE
jgi:hypothetical protein